MGLIKFITALLISITNINYTNPTLIKWFVSNWLAKLQKTMPETIYYE